MRRTTVEQPKNSFVSTPRARGTNFGNWYTLHGANEYPRPAGVRWYWHPPKTPSTDQGWSKRAYPIFVDDPLDHFLRMKHSLPHDVRKPIHLSVSHACSEWNCVAPVFADPRLVAKIQVVDGKTRGMPWCSPLVAKNLSTGNERIPGCSFILSVVSGTMRGP